MTIYGNKRIAFSLWTKRCIFFFQETKVILGFIICIREGFCHCQLHGGGILHCLQWVPLLYMHLSSCCDQTVLEHFLRRLDFLNAYGQGAGGAAS